MIEKEIAKPRLAYHVRRVRRLLGMTQTDLSEASRVEQGTISQIERAKVVPNYVDVINIAEALNTTVETLLKPVEQEQFQKI